MVFGLDSAALKNGVVWKSPGGHKGSLISYISIDSDGRMQKFTRPGGRQNKIFPRMVGNEAADGLAGKDHVEMWFSISYLRVIQ